MLFADDWWEVSKPIIEDLPSLVWCKDTSLKYIASSNHYLEFTQLKREDYMGHSDFEMPWEMAAHECGISDRKVLSGKHSSSIAPIVFPDGSAASIKLRKSPMLSPEGIVRGIFCFVTLVNFNDTQAINVLRQIDYETVSAEHTSHQYALQEDYPYKNLSRREQECLFYALRGLSAKLIAQVLGISNRTVEAHLDSIKLKLNCRTKYDLINKAVKDNIFSLIPKQINIDKLNNLVM